MVASASGGKRMDGVDWRRDMVMLDCYVLKIVFSGTFVASCVPKTAFSGTQVAFYVPKIVFSGTFVASCVPKIVFLGT